MRTACRILRSIAYLLLLVLALPWVQDAACAAPPVSTEKDVYGPGEKIRVHFTDAPGKDSDWICIVPAGSPDTEAGDYQYLPKDLGQGSLTFDSPLPGKYEVRAYYHYRRNGYVVTGRHAFSVAEAVPAAESKTASPARAGAPARKAAPEELSPPPSVPAGRPRYTVSVFHFKPVNMEASGYGTTVTSALINAPRMKTAFALMDRRDLETFLVANDLQQNDQMENVTQIGARLGIHFVIAGSVEKRGTMIITHCKVINIEKREVIFAHRSVSIGESNLITDVMKMSNDIIEAILRSAL